MLNRSIIYAFFLLMLLPHLASSQKTVVVDSTDPAFRTVIAGAEYGKSGFHNFLWGKHYRKEWTTPVKVPVINLDTTAGGLKPTEQGGGRQTKTLRLKNAAGKEYVLRSIDKTYSGALPEIVAGTFLENVANDQVSTAHPFAAVTVPIMIEAAGVFHTNPKIVFVPYTESLGQYNETFANTLCLFEERADDDQSDAANFGNANDVVGTPKMLEKIGEENDHKVDQKAFLRARLFDMFLGDWGRHEDQWRWAKFDEEGMKIYRPIPRDRDQTYTKFDGFLVKKVTGQENLEHLQTFAYKIKNVKKYGFPARFMDRRLTNELPKETWTTIAKELQQSLTDEIIETSVKQMPPELFSISGKEIIAKLKSRRGELLKYAEKYYKYVNEDVEIVGSEQNEAFQIKVLDDHQTQVEVFDLNKEGEAKKHPFYSRIFISDQTDEIRLYGLKGNDTYTIEGGDNSIKIRIIGGTEKDIVTNTSSAKIKYYDNKNNDISGNIRTHLSDKDTAINTYNYKGFKENSGQKILSPSYSNVRGIHINAGYTYTKQGFRKEPFAWQQTLKGYYSITNNSFGGDYVGIFSEVIGKWNLLLNGRYDEKLSNYFFGIGNETVFDKEKKFYNLYLNEAYGSLGFNRIFAKHHTIGFDGFYQMVKVKNETGKFVSTNIPAGNNSVFNKKDFAGANAYYTYLNINDKVIPTKGIGFSANAGYAQNLKDNDRTVNKYTGFFGFYLPITKAISLASRSGGSTITGQPEFYQLSWIGGGTTLRGYNRERFYGKSSFYNNNDLRWLFNVRSYLFNGKMGLIGFFDEGRVWQPGEDSNKWHYGYGGGLLIAPFNKVSLTVYYGMSDEASRIHIKLGKFF